jgi:hypothetical protein
VAFNSTFRYIEDVLSINNNQFHTYVDLIYPNELEIIDITECYRSASYLDKIWKLDTKGKLTTQRKGERDDFNFSMANCPYLCNNIPISLHWYGVYISQLIMYARAWSTYDYYFFYSRQSTDKQVDVTEVSTVSLTGSFSLLRLLQQSSLLIQHSFRPNSVLCVSYYMLSRFWYTDLDYVSNHLPELELGLTAGVTVNRVCLLLLGTWSHLCYIQRSVCALFSNLHYLQDSWDWWLFVIYAISFTP